MSISKKLRFEIFKRDGFQCAYCGKSPPEVTLEIDHIEPRSKGGQDDIDNYITSCFDCNRGKSNIRLTSIVPKIAEKFELLKEKEDQLKEYRKFIQKIEKRVNQDIKEISAIYSEKYKGWDFSDQFKKVSIKRFLKHLLKQEIEEALHLAIIKFPKDKDRVIHYFCGICWNKIKRQ